MSYSPIHSTALYHAMVAEQFPLPDNCAGVEIEFPVNGPLVIRYRVFVTGENAEKLGRALVRCGESSRPDGKVQP